eukprot:1161011-Pelagomonas_calceolata.AAC.5
MTAPSENKLRLSFCSTSYRTGDDAPKQWLALVALVPDHCGEVAADVVGRSRGGAQRGAPGPRHCAPHFVGMQQELIWWAGYGPAVKKVEARLLEWYTLLWTSACSVPSAPGIL